MKSEGKFGARSAAEDGLDEPACEIRDSAAGTVEKIRRLLRSDPLNANAYRSLAKALKSAESSGVVRAAIKSADPLLARAARALASDDLETAEIILRKRLLEQPGSDHALYLMAKLARALDFEREAEELIRLVLEIEPHSSIARIELAALLDKRHRPIEACKELEVVLAREPHNEMANILKAAALGRSGGFAESAGIYRQLLETAPNDPWLWSTYGYTLKTMGEVDEGLQAMRQATKVAPHSGEAWWNLSNLKTVRFDASDIATMQAALNRRDLSDSDRLHMHFALGKAHEDAGEAATAFDHYREANGLRRRTTRYHPRAVSMEVEASIKLFSRPFFEQRAGSGTQARDPIFVLGLPRSGSTLIEQILASHAQIEGTKELHEIPIIARDLGRGTSAYFRTVESLTERRISGARGGISRAGARSAHDHPALLRRQDAQQLAAPSAHSSDVAQGEDHRCAPASARVRLLQLQAELRAGPRVQLRPRLDRPSLSRIRADDGAHRIRYCPGASIA